VIGKSLSWAWWGRAKINRLPEIITKFDELIGGI